MSPTTRVEVHMQAPPTILFGRPLILARTLWLIVASLTLYVFVAGVPTTFH